MTLTDTGRTPQLAEDQLPDDPTVEAARAGGKPMLEADRGLLEHVMVYLFVVVPFLAVLAAVPVAWGWGLSWLDVALFAVFYAISASGITVGYHRYFTHGSFKANRGLKIYLAIAGSLAIEGPVVRWVADHRRHHAYSDREGDPHSPWRYGNSAAGVAKGFWYSHLGWLFDKERTNLDRYAPDLLADRDIAFIDRTFVGWVIATLLLPGLIALAITGSFTAAISAFFWASLVRVALLHHVTWAINSVCHLVGTRKYASRDQSRNFWPLAILSFGESWHNSHHADPTCARHGVDRGQIDISARMIWLFTKFGWASDVRWAKRDRFDRLAARRAAEVSAE